MKFIALSFIFASTVFGAPIRQHSHERFLTAVRNSLNLDNPDQILDPVFALLGNAAASQGLGRISDPDCLQLATADRAFTNAKNAGDVDGQVAALIYRTLERNTGRVGLPSVPCTSIQAVNPEIAALQQHQDPASNNAAAINKDITLELARQIAAVGGNPVDAILSGTFAPGDINDPTGRGNSCDDLDDPVGCIFTKNLLVPDATEDEIQAAVAGVSSPSPQPQPAPNNNTPPPSSNTPAPQPTPSTPAPPSGNNTGNNNGNNNNGAATGSGRNLQSFAGALGGARAPGVVAGGRGFLVEGSDSFLNLNGALGRSCDIQHNACANAANSGRVPGLTVGQCDQQNTACKAAIN
ncbi:hypothetical protein AX16_008411 [Volvariella volvacea WC 439]|nr:hypothetical protein AX16_008411 [Volvariella volvacea WC 439]